MGKKNDGGKVSGLNRFLYRGYEVYDSEGNIIESRSSNHEKTFTVRKDRNPKEAGTIEVDCSSVSDAVFETAVAEEKGEKTLTVKKVRDPKQVSSIEEDCLSAKEPEQQKKELVYGKRPIRDGKVWENLNKLSDPITVAGLSGGIFNGYAEQKLEYIKLSDAKKTITPRKIISEVIDMQQHIILKDGLSYFHFEAENKKVIVPKRLIVFVKAAIAAQYNVCIQYSSVIASFINELTGCIRQEDYYLPISVPVGTKLQEVILSELNEYIGEIFDQCCIKYSEVMPVVKDKKIKKHLNPYEEIMSAAGAAKGD